MSDNIGFIYQIENIINGKKYIGMTRRTIEVRKAEHMKTFNNSMSKMYNFKLYQAMRKYGFSNFKFSIVEKCPNDKLENREKYYIELYNTIIKGYNETLGGNGRPLLSNKQVEACKILYKNGWMLKDISDVFKSNPKTISKKLKEFYNINTKENSRNNNSKPIIGINKDENILEFLSLSDAARYLIENNITKNVNLSSIVSKISNSLKDPNKTAYGYKWKYKIK